MAQTQVILMERVGSLGEMGEVVTVKPGFARNYLLPQGKALRASKENIAYFEAQKKTLQAENDKRKKEAEAIAKKLDGLTVDLIRQASEAGQLYGSVTSRDIAKEASEASKQDIDRSMIQLNQNYKMIGLFPIDVQLHPEVSVEITINIARSAEEAETQAKTGKALISDAAAPAPEQKAEAVVADEAALEEVLEESALEAEMEKQEAAAQEAESEEQAEKVEEPAAEDKAEEDADAAEEQAEDEKA